MYYRLNDLQCGGCLHTGFNASSLDQLKRDFISYAEPDMEEDEISYVQNANLMEFSIYLYSGFELELETSMLPFPEQDEE